MSSELMEAPVVEETAAPPPEAKKATPFHPLLFALFPILSLYSANLAMVPASHLLRPMLLALGGTIVAWLLLSGLLRSFERGAVGATVLVLSFFSFSFLVERFQVEETTMQALLVWGGFTLLIMLVAALKLKATKFMNVFSLFVLVAAVAQISIAKAGANKLNVTDEEGQTKTVAAGAKRPDIFYIVLDGYGRSDALKKSLGYDNTWFIEALKERGFYVADKSVSNYMQTELSLASTMNMDYIQTLAPDTKPDEESRGLLQSALEHNEVFRQARLQGYKIVAVSTGFPPLRFTRADVRLRNRSGATLFETVLLQKTPLVAREGAVESLFDERREHLQRAFRDLASLAIPSSSPRLVVAHILAPHPPFVFGANGEHVTNMGEFSFADGSHFIGTLGSAQEYRKNFAGQVEYTSKQVIRTLDRLLASKQKPVIIIQGDHGSKLHLHQESLEQTDLHEVFPILNAYYVPDSIREELRPDVTPVNTFRLVYRKLFGLNLPDLPEKNYFNTWPRPFDFVDVTDKVATDRK
jgi:hypothetical protein